jgi:hypothetical protein
MTGSHRNFTPPPIGDSLGKERRVHAAAGQKENLCRLKPAFLGGGVKLYRFPGHLC